MSVGDWPASAVVPIGSQAKASKDECHALAVSLVDSVADRLESGEGRAVIADDLTLSLVVGIMGIATRVAETL